MRLYRGPAFAFRMAVLAAFHEAGFTAAHAWLGAGEPDGHAPPDEILGLPLRISTRNAKTIDLGEAMRSLEAREHPMRPGPIVSVQARRGHPVGKAYATMTLDGLLQLLARAYPSEAPADLVRHVERAAAE